MFEVVQKDVMVAENDERYQKREEDDILDIKTQPVLCCIRTPGV